MNRNNIIEKIIFLLDKQILKILSSDEVDNKKLSIITDRLSDLTDIRILYVEELNNLIRGQNTSDMYDKKYWDSYRRNNH